MSNDCNERGERGERGKRGHRGHRGRRGHNGHDGPLGPPGPAGEGGRRVLASCFVDGTGPTYANVQGFGPITRLGPAGDYALGLFPDADMANVDFATGVLSIDKQPAVLTLLSGPPGTVRVLITHLDGTPADAQFSIIVLAAT